MRTPRMLYLLLCLPILCLCSVAVAAPPQAPPIDDSYASYDVPIAPECLSGPNRSEDCTCQDEGEDDGCNCQNCECKLCIGSPTSIDESTGSLSTAKKNAVPLTNVNLTIPQAPPISLQDGGTSAAATQLEDSARITEAYRRLRAAGYEFVEKEEAQLCDTCPNGFLYTGKTFYTVEKDYSEGQTVSSPQRGPDRPLDEQAMREAIYVSSSGESSCGSDGFSYSYSGPTYRTYYSKPATYSYGSEYGCGTDGFSGYGYSSPTYYSTPASYAAPRGTGFFGRLFGGGARGFGGCLTGNCG